MEYEISLTESSGALFLRAPFNPEANTDYRNIGGKWKEEHRAWRFDVRDRDRLREILRTHFGRDDRPVLKSVTARVDLDEAASGYRPEIRMFGRVIAARLHRDAPVRLGDGVILIDGKFSSSGGSVRNPEVGALEGIILEVRDIPAGHLDMEDSGVEVIADGHGPDLTALEAERTQLLARLAEIEAAIETAKAP